jgi:lysophospholipase L1-like esterase
MRRELSITLCAAIAAAAFVCGYKVHEWRYPLTGRNRYVVRKEAVLEQLRPNRLYHYVVVGDSITEFADLPSLCGKSLPNAGISGAAIHDAAELMDDLASILRAGTIIIAVGINDADTTRRRSDTIAQDFERLVRLAKDTAAEVFAATLAPMDATKPAGAARDPGLVAAINAQIRASMEHEHVISLDANLKPDETGDGVHLAEVGARHWRGAIEAAVCPAWSSAHASGRAAQIPR